MTTITATQATTQTVQRTHDNYGRLWVRVPQELGFLLLNLPVAIISLVVLSTLFFTGLGLIAILVGVFITVAAMYTARAFGTFELLRLQWAGRPRIARPQWEKPG
ncbi:MAG: sensor domain-containing protein, partial [Microterricola sp.]